jgi:membrane protease YdiL (CAAX protease family)
MAILVLATALVAYNNLVNLWPPFNRAAYVPVNLVVAALLIAVSLGPLGLGLEEIGLRAISIASIALGAGLGALVAGPVLVAAVLRKTRRLVKDNRVRDMSPGRLAYQVLVRVPFGTALLEEVAFRGVLIGARQGTGFAAAAIASSAAFGLWHVTPTLHMMRANQPDASTRTVALVVAGTIVLTFSTGLLLAWLRKWTGGLAAPFGMHATVNSLATVGAWLAHRLDAPR